MRIVSLLPSATEILYALGLGDAIVGVSHECDYPPEARTKPQLLDTVIDQDRLSSRQIDQAVRVALERRTSLYRVNEAALREAGPDLGITQELCAVCAVPSTQVHEAIGGLPKPPQVVSLHPHTLEEMLEDIRLVGEAAHTERQAEQLVTACRRRLQEVQKRLASVSSPLPVFCLEWLEPPMATGHWVPEMVERAGGREVLGRPGEPSRYVSDAEIVAAAPEVLILMPCGFSVERTRQELDAVKAQPWWERIPAVRNGRVYAVNGPAYFNRSGPRLIDGVELLAVLLHPDACADLATNADLAPSGSAMAKL